jgi:hypothetical protein
MVLSGVLVDDSANMMMKITCNHNDFKLVVVYRKSPREAARSRNFLSFRSQIGRMIPVSLASRLRRQSDSAASGELRAPLQLARKTARR